MGWMAEGGWDGMGGGGFVRMFATLSSAGLASGVKLPHHVRAATFDACHIRWQFQEFYIETSTLVSIDQRTQDQYLSSFPSPTDHGILHYQTSSLSSHYKLNSHGITQLHHPPRTSARR